MDAQMTEFVIWAAVGGCVVLVVHSALAPVIGSRRRRFGATVVMLGAIVVFAWYAANGFHWQPLPWNVPEWAKVSPRKAAMAVKSFSRASGLF
jgi:hypothetical protein